MEGKKGEWGEKYYQAYKRVVEGSMGKFDVHPRLTDSSSSSSAASPSGTSTSTSSSSSASSSSGV